MDFERGLGMHTRPLVYVRNSVLLNINIFKFFRRYIVSATVPNIEESSPSTHFRFVNFLGNSPGVAQYNFRGGSYTSPDSGLMEKST